MKHVLRNRGAPLETSNTNWTEYKTCPLLCSILWQM